MKTFHWNTILFKFYFRSEDKMESEAKLKNEAAVTTIEDLYKYFEILSEITKENAEQVKF